MPLCDHAIKMRTIVDLPEADDDMVAWEQVKADLGVLMARFPVDAGASVSDPKQSASPRQYQSQDQAHWDRDSEDQRLPERDD